MTDQEKYDMIIDDRIKLKRIDTITRNLYELMPGAMPVSIEQFAGDQHYGQKLWGEVENTPHYEFCHAIANLIVRNSAVVVDEELPLTGRKDGYQSGNTDRKRGDLTKVRVTAGETAPNSIRRVDWPQFS